eukprot:1691576-Amphidinium_carterae.1
MGQNLGFSGCTQQKNDVRGQSEDQECDQLCDQHHNYEESEQSQIIKAGQVQGTQQSNALKLNIKVFLPRKFKGDRGQFKAWADEVMLFLSIEEPRFTNIFKRLQTIRQPITDANVISECHALVQSLIHTACGYETWRQLKIQYYE